MTDADVADLKVAIARIETKLDAALTVGADHEARIRRLERAVWLAAGAAAAAGGTLGSLATHILGA